MRWINKKRATEDVGLPKGSQIRNALKTQIGSAGGDANRGDGGGTFELLQDRRASSWPKRGIRG